jgi:hypothetical protein
MSRLFYHVMQDNAGNLLFDVSGTMRVAGSGTLATIYGDPGLTVILPNPMTNHPSFGSFKCYLGAGSYDFHMAKSGYTFETLTGLQGWGTMALQNADGVVITGGSARLALGAAGTTDEPGYAWTAEQLYVRAAARVQGICNVGGTLTAETSALVLGALRVGSAVAPGQTLDVTGYGRFSGGLIIGASSPAIPAAVTSLYYDKSGLYGLILRQQVTDTGPGGPVVFQNVAGTPVGSISTNATVTAYNTSSDVRLKHAITALTGALDVIRALNPVSFKWNADDSDGHGFLAHELQATIPDAVSGEPEAVDEDGTMRPQGVDQSKLVPWLVGAIQELAQRLATLEQARA